MSELYLAKKTFLVVDDENFTRMIVLTMLRDLGAGKTFAAKDGAEAANMLQEDAKNVDCVIADFNMPEMNGLELLKAIRTGRDGIRREIPFAMLTGNSDRDLVGLAIAFDVNAFLIKPVSKRALQDRLTRVFGERRPMKPIEAYAHISTRLSDEALEASPGAVQSHRQPAMAVAPSAAATVHAAAPAAHAQAAPSGPKWGPETQVAINAIPIGSLLTRDVIVSGCRVMAVDTVLGDAEVQKLQGFADLADLLGSLPEIWVRMPA